MTETNGNGAVTVDKKDITYDVLMIDDEDERSPGSGPGGSAGGPAEDRGDHPVIYVLDLAVKQSGEYLKGEGLPPPNNAVYENFSKPFLNDALWHYLPDGGVPDDPRIALALGVAGLGLAFAPTAIALWHRRQEEEKREQERQKQQKREREARQSEQAARTEEAGQEHKGEPEEREHERPSSPGSPTWLQRIASGGGGRLGGM